MSVFQLLSCNVALGGDILNVVARHEFAPVTYPEMLALRFIHGETAITEIFDVGAVERDENDERRRLRETYSAAVIDRMFPGAGQRLPNGDNGFKPRAVPLPQNAVAPEPDVILPAGVTDFNTVTPGATYVPPTAPVPDPAKADTDPA